ncbi:MAG: right-handed parallel beta-helix repeat-containing protein [Pirellulales bacterium]|nr:right-handed parallel beta-helix repeat-containing protein [Pirellulales bacterium]
MMKSLCCILVVIVVTIVGPLYSKEQQTPNAPADAATNCAHVVTNQTVTELRTFSEPMEVSRGVRFIKGKDGRLIFKHPLKAPRTQIFQGFLPGDVVFDAETVVFPEWWGASAAGDPALAGTNVTALNAACAAVGKSPLAISLSGVYYINGKIFPRSRSRLIAQKHGGFKAIPNLVIPAGEYLVEINGQSDVILDGIEINGNRANQPQDRAHTFGGILVIKSDRCTIKNSKVHDCNGPTAGGALGNGIRTLKATDILICKNQLYSNNGCGINLYFSSHNIRVLNNKIWNNTEIGIESEGRNGGDYKNYRNSEITIADNDISGKTEPNRPDDHSILVDWTDNVVISGNRCQKNNHNGIEILGSHKVDVARNYCAANGDVGPPRYTWAGVRVGAEGFGEDGRSYDVTIRDNQIVGSQFGIYIDTASRVTVRGNKISGTPNAALTIGARTTEVKTSDNDIQGTK